MRPTIFRCIYNDVKKKNEAEKTLCGFIFFARILSYLSNRFLVSVYNNRATLCRERNSYLLSNNLRTCCNNPPALTDRPVAAFRVSRAGSGSVICIIRSSFESFNERDTESLVVSGGPFELLYTSAIVTRFSFDSQCFT